MRNDCLNLQLIKTEQTGLQPSFLRALRDDFGLTTFMETGTFRGDTTAVAAKIFESVHSFELSAELHANALKRFSVQANVHLHQGDSAELLPRILASGPREKILFWLDGHFSGGPTAQGKANTPILDEIRAIAAAGIKDCVVLVDDLRCFQKSGPGTPPSLTGYPTVWELREALRAIFPKLSFAHYGDVALAFPADSGPALSPALQGCTVSRLFDSLPADFAAPPVEELFQAEQLIAHATGSEFEAIVALAAAYPSGEKHGLGGHYQLWAGLALNQAGKLAEARKCFSRALELNCDHWRVRCYLAAALGELGEMGEAFMELNEARLLAPGQPLVTAIEQTLLQAKVQQRESSSGRGASGRSTPSSANPEANGETAVLRRFIKPEAVVFDVGAHAGHWTDAVLAHCPSARVHLFEPLPAHTQTLRERFAEGIGRGQLSVEACALGERDEAREFHHYTASPAWSGLHRRRSVEREAGVQPPESLQVQVIPLDDYCRSAGVSRIGFLKIDVEGGELAVLRGAEQLLRRGDIDVLQFEYGGTYRDAGVTLREVFGYLQSLGYLVFRIAATGVEHCPKFIPTMEDYCYANFLAAHPRFRATLLESKPRMLDLAALSSEHGLQPRGVIHVGAHEGKEYERYQAMGFGKILFVEANPAVFARLKARLDGKPGVVLANCAISDRAGMAKLRVTSMDQSSSLLPLKLHSKIYPDIVETQQVEVRTITLDALLAERGLAPADFNFLNIDIQGAELLALRGAEKTLRHIEAINTEVNLAELYEGCARLEEVDLHLKRRSFSRVAMVTPFHPSWGDAFYVRSVEAGGLITMSSLGKNGRFANQLFQYAFLKCYAQKHGLRVETPAWVGQKLFGFADPAVSLRLPEFRERSNQLTDALVPNAANPIQNVDFWGFFQYKTRYYAPQRDYFRSLFRPTPQALAHVQPMLEKLRSRGKTIVGLHLRRGDYGYEHFFVAPSAWYLEWLRSLWPTLEEPVLFIASDEPEKVLADFSEFNPVTTKDLGPTLAGADFYPDFFLLSQCDALAISNSSFSFAAAMLNERGSIFARPHLPTQKLIPFNPWNSETLLRDAKVGQASSLSLPSTTHQPAPAIQPVAAKDRLEACPTFSFVTIVLNGMPFLEFALRAVYDFAHEIIIVEGAVENCRFAATPDGSSTDGTVECIRNFPDPQKKIRLIQGAWPEKCEMQNAALEHVKGDYVWLMDADEIYRRADLEKVRGLIEKDGSITQINVIPDNFWKGFDHIFVSPKFFEPAAHYRRIFKFVPGARFTSHRPPTMVHPGSKRTTEQMNCIRGDVTRAMGIVPFHYSYVVESQVAQKVELYNRYGWGKQWKIDMNEWLRECWQKWTPENRAEIESRYPVWTGGHDSRTEPFDGEHPEVMREFIQQLRERKPTESQALAVIGDAGSLHRTIQNWSKIQLDAPLQKRRAEIEQHLSAGTPFWNNHVGLAFLAHRLQPASYLEIGCRTGGSFVQVLSVASLKEATAVDLWAGIYSDLPNTKEFAASQIERCLKAPNKTCRVELRQGNSHLELKKLRAEGRTFDLINVDGDHTDEGAMQDLEDALALLSHRGAILFDDIIHPGFPTLLGVVKSFAARHPELSLVLNTTQDNGVAILLRGVSVSELLRDETPGDSSTQTQERARAAQPPRRLKIAGEVATKADLTQIDSNSAFAQAIRKIFAEIRPIKIIETGTYLGTGTTKVIAEAIRDLKLKDVAFHSIEVRPQHFETAKRNLAKSGLSGVVELHHGLSVPRRLLPTLQQIEEETVRTVECEDLFVDHQEHERVLLYFKETDFSAVPDDLLGQCLRQFENRPDFVLLDSAGHMGHLEFEYLLSQLKGPCYIALDDIHHIKHHRSFRQMQSDPRFELIVSSREKFGFCIAKFTPAAVAGVDATVQRLLWVRTDAIGDAALASSMLPHIRANYPAAKIAVLCREHLAEFYLACPHIQTIICFDWQKASQDEAYRKSIVTEIVGFQPELVLNSIYSREPLTELLALAFPAEKFIGMQGNLSNISVGAKQRFDAKYTEIIASPGEHKLELERHRDFLAGLGLQVEKLEPQVWTTSDDEAVAAAFFEQEKLDPARTIAVFPGAQNARRIYPQYADVLKPFADFRFLIFGDEKAASLARQISAALPGQCINLAGKTTLRETAALLRRCRLYVGAESAGAHFACAVGVPNVVVLGGGHFGRFMPYSPLTSVACLPLDCFGCDWRCRHAKPHCVKDVAPEVITEAIRDTLAKSSNKTRLFVQGESLWKPESGQPALGSLKGHLPAGEYEIICVERRGPVMAPSPAHASSTNVPPLVTAIVSTYNSERFLRGCLEDLEAQTIADRLEIIVVDSGSEQNERAIVEEFQQKYSNIVYLRTEREPLYAAWNRAIGIARGKYLTNANADDRHRPDAYEILARTLDEQPVGIVYSDSFTTSIENETFATTKSRRTFDWPKFTLKELLTRNFFGPHPMWRRSVHAEIGLFKPEYTIAGDYDFNLRVASKFGARRVPEVLGLYLEGGMESKSRKLCVDETRRLLRQHRREIAIEQIYPELQQPGLTPQRQAELLVDYAVTLATTWHPDVDLAKELYRCAAGICPEYVQALEKASGKRGPEVSGNNSIAPDKSARTPGYSFCIITNGKRLVKLQQEIQSIRALKIPAFEILVGGDVPTGLGEDVAVLSLPEAAQAGRLGEMRNRLIERARFDHLVVADDDMIFHADFFSGLKQFGEDYEVLCTRLLNPDGSRFWDWATVGGPRGQTILGYDESDPFVYVTGGLCVMKISVVDRVQWDAGRGFYQSEDVDFSRRLQAAGISIRFNRHSTVTHNDARYTLDGPVVVRIEGALALAKQDYETGRVSMARHRLERALRLWPWAKSEILKFAAKFGDGPTLESLANQPTRPNSLFSEPRVELKLPVRWAGPFFGEGDEAGRAAALVEPLANRVWLGIHHHGVPWVERAVERLPSERREVLFAMADCFPAMLGGVGISQSVPENFAKLPGAAWSIGFVPMALKQLSPDQAACCREMDEVWVAETAQAEAFAKCGVVADMLRVVRGAKEVFARLQEIEARLLETVDESTGVLTGVLPPHPGATHIPERRALLGTVAEEGPSRAMLGAPVSVAWEGSFLDLGSLSHVNRAITAELAREAGVEVTCIGRNAVPKELAAMDELQAMARRLRSHASADTQVTVRHAWPPDWSRPKRGAWVLIQPWEFGALPVEWMQPLARVDEVWVPSEFVRRCYIESGVDERKVHVVPNGIDPQRFQPQARPRFLATQKKFKFLFVGGTIHRKGPDVLLKAFVDNFTATDDVCLVIKDFGGQSVYAGQTFSAQIRAAQARPNAPEILYLTDDVSAEDMPGLYTACDCLVHPYRGEGFGLPVLEAMACGLAVVVTAGGSTDDFATDELAYCIPAQWKEFGNSVSGMKLVKPGWLLEPDVSALGERLKWIVANPAEAKARGQAAGEKIRSHWTWARAASVAARRLRDIASRQGARPASKKTAKPIELPACAKLGHLASARQLFQAGKLLPAWEATLDALRSRPFHPEAFLMLAEIAQATGDLTRAKALAEHARSLAPAWKPAKQFLKSPPRRGSAAVALPELPRALAPSNPASRIPRLTVCLIAKNEERFIGQCLESIRPIADQIVLVDTGSTDWTTSIGGRFGAEIYKFKWCDDFSAARNVALEKATGDWVLMLDADEELPADQQSKLLKLLRDAKAIAYRLPMIDVGQEEAGVSYVPRLFRNAPGLFYVGRVHEQIFSSVEVRRAEWGLENQFGDSTLLHHGYTKEMVKSRDKVARNLRLLEMAVEEMPGEPNLLMNLGLELMRTGRTHEGLENYEAAFEAMSRLPKAQVVPELRESLLTQFATHLVAAKRFADVVRVLTSPVTKSGGLTASMHWLLGLACVELKQFSEGAAQMRDCLAKRERPALTPVLKDIRKGAPYHALAVCLVSMKQVEAAQRAFESALKDEPENRGVRFDFARSLANNGEAVEALKWAHQLMADDPSDVAVWRFGGQVALGNPEFIEFARDWTSEAMKSHPDVPALAEQRATAMLLSGELEEALPLWRQLGEGNPTVVAARLICEAGSGAALSSVAAASSSAKVNEAFLLWYRRLLQFNATKAVLSVNARVEELRSFVPAAANVIGAAVAAAA